MKVVTALISILLVGAVVAAGCGTAQPPPTVSSEFAIPSVAKGEISNPKLAMVTCYEPEGISISPDDPGYLLPLELNEITNFADVESKFELTGNQEWLRSHSLARR